jgi:hypothetical protein
MYHCLLDWTRQAVCFTILLPGGTIGLRDGSMDRDVADQTETEEDMLTLDVSDDALERTAIIGQGKALTWAYCTHGWYDCGWPQ